MQCRGDKRSSGGINQRRNTISFVVQQMKSLSVWTSWPKAWVAACDPSGPEFDYAGPTLSIHQASGSQLAGRAMVERWGWRLASNCRHTDTNKSMHQFMGEVRGGGSWNTWTVKAPGTGNSLSGRTELRGVGKKNFTVVPKLTISSVCHQLLLSSMMKPSSRILQREGSIHRLIMKFSYVEKTAKLLPGTAIVTHFFFLIV